MAKKIASFIASNLLGTIVDTVVLWLFSHFVFETYSGKYLISPCISFECAVFVNFLCAYYFIWKSRVSHRNLRSFLRHLAGYNLSCVGVFLVKMAILLLIERIFGWNVVICNLVALCFSGILNFAMGEFVIFGRRKQQNRDEVMESIIMDEEEDRDAAA